MSTAEAGPSQAWTRTRGVQKVGSTKAALRSSNRGRTREGTRSQRLLFVGAAVPLPINASLSGFAAEPLPFQGAVIEQYRYEARGHSRPLQRGLALLGHGEVSEELSVELSVGYD